MLRNPAYAGIYAYGRTRFDPNRKIPGHPHTGRRRTAAGDWLVMIPGLLPAYITVGQYERNLARMRDNRARAEAAWALPGRARPCWPACWCAASAAGGWASPARPAAAA